MLSTFETTIPPFNVFRCDDAAIIVHRELGRIEDSLVADVAVELLHVFVEGPRVQRDVALVAFHAHSMEGLSVSGHDLDIDYYPRARSVRV